MPQDSFEGKTCVTVLLLQGLKGIGTVRQMHGCRWPNRVMTNPPNQQLKDVRLVDIPGYMEWSRQYVDEYPALIAHLDATSMMLTDRDLESGVETELFEELLDDLKDTVGE